MIPFGITKTVSLCEHLRVKIQNDAFSNASERLRKDDVLNQQ